MLCDTIDFRYLIYENIYDELRELARDTDKIVSGWLLAQRKQNVAIVDRYLIDRTDSKCHIKPRSWAKFKKYKLKKMWELKDEYDVPIVYQFHTHPDGKDTLTDVDKQFLEHYGTGVMVLILPDNIIGWYYQKLFSPTGQPFYDKMHFELVSI